MTLLRSPRLAEAPAQAMRTTSSWRLRLTGVDFVFTPWTPHMEAVGAIIAAIFPEVAVRKRRVAQWFKSVGRIRHNRTMYSAAMWTRFVTAWLMVMASWLVSDLVPVGAFGGHPVAGKAAIAGATAGAISLVIDLLKHRRSRVSAR